MLPGRVSFYTRGIIWSFFLATNQNHFNNVGREHGIKISVSQKKKSFDVFLMKFNVKLWPPGRGQFWPQEYNWINFGRGPLDDAIYQISKIWAF